jgi:putative transcriptional regulator
MGPLHPTPRRGDFLVASPILRDPNFQRTVVLLCEHDEDEGSMGLVVNRPTEVTLQTALQIGPPAGQQMWFGGPVQRDTVLVLHRGADLPGARQITDGMSLGGEEEAIVELLCSARHTNARVFTGYSGWSRGQLSDELESASWITCRGAARFVFDVEPENMWGAVLRSLGPKYSYLADLPLDPRVN